MARIDPDSEAFEQLLQSGYRYAFSLTHDAAEAEDLVQDACLSVLAAHEGSFEKAYLYTTIRNRFIDKYRRGKKLLFLSIEGGESDRPAEEVFADPERWDPPDVLAAGQLEEALVKLRPEEREVMFLAVVEGYTAQEIAGMTERPRGTILSLLHRTRNKLRSLLAPRGVSENES